jgi:hypothetical protein
MTTKPRSGVALLPEERWAALIGNAIDGLESFQAPLPCPSIETVLDTLRFVRAGLLKQVASKIAPFVGGSNDAA